MIDTHGDLVPLTTTAVVDALLADPGLVALLGAPTAVYVGEAPWKTGEAETPAPYVIVTGATANESNRFANVGGVVTLAVDLWAPGEPRVGELYREAARVLHRQPLTLADLTVSPPITARFLRGRLALLATLRDPGRRRLWHGVGRYTCEASA